jgi:2-dehydro-3-deoxyphosphogluconate aldolase/(4S)-4-hydroxy-2-oxoglutarate aldolase
VRPYLFRFAAVGSSLPMIQNPGPFSPESGQSFEQQWRAALVQYRAIAVIRARDFTTGLAMAEAVAAGGMRLLEITWNSDRPSELLRELRRRYPHCWVGAGTILTPADLQTAISAGAQFIFSPHTAPALIQTALHHQIPVIPGALSPTEIVTAWQQGATCVKVFPAQRLGGAAYLRSLRDPLPDIPLIPTGGITVENALDYLQAGAIALGLASSLFPAEAVAQGRWDEVTAQAERLVAQLQTAASRF